VLELLSRSLETFSQQRTHFPLSILPSTCFPFIPHRLQSSPSNHKDTTEKKQHKEPLTQRNHQSSPTMALFNAYRVVVSSPITPHFHIQHCQQEYSRTRVRTTHSGAMVLLRKHLITLLHPRLSSPFCTTEQHFNTTRHVLRQGIPVFGRPDPGAALLSQRGVSDGRFNNGLSVRPNTVIRHAKYLLRSGFLSQSRCPPVFLAHEGLIFHV
jgi:hypothetical protein